MPLLLILFSLFYYGNSYCFNEKKKYENEKGWDQLSGILKKIKKPKFPNKEFLIIKYGAIADRVTDCKLCPYSKLHAHIKK